MLLEKVKKANLQGRSGSSYSTYQKWIKLSSKKGDKYLICNAAEGEPGVFKDRWLIENEMNRIVKGIALTVHELDITEVFFYVKQEYYKNLKKTIEESFADSDFDMEVKLKEHRYIAGEETAVINSIEGKRAEPESKPPYPTDNGLWGKPTLVHNLETFYAINEIAEDNYNKERFFHITGAVENEGVFKFRDDLTIEEILKKSGNYPDFNFIAQVGGGAGGLFFKKNELSENSDRLGAIKIFNSEDFNWKKEMFRISEFLMYGNCDKCTPCREGIYRINEMIKNDEFNEDIFNDLILVMEKSSQCPLGRIAAETFKSLKRL